MQFLICPKQNMSALLVSSVIPSFIDYVDPMADCQIEQETDYTGVDLSSGPAESQQDCADICASTQLGLVWTFSWGKNCYIKRSITGRVKNPNAVSGNYKCGSKIAVGGNLSISISMPKILYIIIPFAILHTFIHIDLFSSIFKC